VAGALHGPLIILLQQQGADAAAEGSFVWKDADDFWDLSSESWRGVGRGKPDGKRMGLSICQSIIEALGGLIWASLRVPHGTAFRFTVPTDPLRSVVQKLTLPRMKH
jgi:Histidine kinase-, DNA gyrase B-, and HSP90-like ATPase